MKLHERGKGSFQGPTDAKVTFLCFCSPEENLTLPSESNLLLHIELPTLPSYECRLSSRRPLLSIQHEEHFSAILQTKLAKNFRILRKVFFFSHRVESKEGETGEGVGGEQMNTRGKDGDRGRMSGCEKDNGGKICCLFSPLEGASKNLPSPPNRT